MIFLSGLNGKFYINFTVNNVFEKLNSKKIVHRLFQSLIQFIPRVHDLAGAKKSHSKASSTFQLMIYNGSINFFSGK